MAALARVASLGPMAIGMPSSPGVVAGGSATMCREAGIGTVLTSAADLAGGGLVGRPAVTSTMMRTITAMITTTRAVPARVRIRLARSSAARRSAAFRCDSARRCALDCVPLVIVRPI